MGDSQQRADRPRDHPADAGPEPRESEYVDPDDLTVQRDGEGVVIPQVEQAGDLGKVKVRPMTYGDVQDRFGDGTNFDFDSADIADIINEYIIEPDLANASPTGRVDADFIESMYPMAPRDLLMAVLEASGVNADVEAQPGGGASVSVEGN